MPGCGNYKSLVAGWALLCSILVCPAQTVQPPSATEVVAKLDEFKATLAAEVTAAMKTNTYAASYTTVWRNFEDDAQAAFCVALKKHIAGLTDASFDVGQTGTEKNRLADLAIVLTDGTVEVSIKAARRRQNPENDMGTFRDHPNRKKLFVASFTLFGRYDDSGPAITVERVFFDRTYRFVGKSTLVDGGVKYRKKDGNMRPKPWAMFDSGKAYWNTDEEFEAAMKKSQQYRATSLVKEYIQDMTDDEQRLLYEELKGKFSQ
jgi:hypothetical protein